MGQASSLTKHWQSWFRAGSKPPRGKKKGLMDMASVWALGAIDIRGRTDH